MSLLFLDALKEMSGYKTRRGVQSWLARMNLRLVRIGKNFAVEREAFEREFSKQHKIIIKQKGYTPTQKTEQAFLAEVDRLLSENNAR